jgi:hypothetical protein
MSKSLLALLVRLPFFLVLWVLFLAIKIPTLLLGFVVVPFLYRYRHKPFMSVPAFFRPWQNPEDWNDGPKGQEDSLPQWWVDQKGVGFRSWYHYHALRNGANGLRNFELLDLTIEKRLVRYWTPTYHRYYEPWYQRKRKDGPSVYGYWAWQGWQSGAKFVWQWSKTRHWVIKFGWRVEPRDAMEKIDPDGIRSEDAGFASKFIPWRKG